MSIYKVKNRGESVTETDEFLISGESDVANLPDSATPGSIAYTANLSSVYIKDIDGTWVAAIEPEPDSVEDSNG